MKFPTISYRDLDRMLDQGADVVVVDLRSREEYASERIRGSINIPYEELDARSTQLPWGRPVVFCCDRGAKSLMACRTFSQRGLVCANLAGGMAFYGGKYIDRNLL